MNTDRFKFRVPFYDRDNNFIGFEELDITKGIEPYNYGKVYYQEFEQSTGLKDKNKILVYENDIVKSHRGEVGMIKWNTSTAQFYITKKTGEYVDYMDDICNYEVIGNIHQNCDLLGSK